MNTDAAQLLLRWFAICCKPRQEFIALENLLRQNFRVYLPRIKVQKHLRGKWVEKIEALFPRYIFIQINPEKQSIGPIRSTRGVVTLVNFGGKPAVVSDAVMATLLLRGNADTDLLESAPLFNAGDPVKLLEGSLAGMEGIFVEEDGAKRVIILLELLGKSNRVRVSRDSLVKAG